MQKTEYKRTHCLGSLVVVLNGEVQKRLSYELQYLVGVGKRCGGGVFDQEVELMRCMSVLVDREM